MASFLVEKTPTNSAFPAIRIQSDAALSSLHRFISLTLQNGEWPLPHYMNDVAFEFITCSRPSESLLQHIRLHCEQEDADVMKTILVLRGLIGEGVLMHCLLEKRWRVQYGLDFQRSQLAVPFRAKDSPSPRSDFGHPDVIILLTCLSYYYYGLDLERFK